jgi:N-acetylglutamate synthase-like GNAT family acetyltransferase
MTTTDVVIRAARPADQPTLQRIFRDASLTNAGDRARLLAHPEHLLLDQDLIGRGRTRVATLTDGRVIAFASTRVSSPHALELDDLFTDPDWRRRGAALSLVRQIVAEAADEQMTTLQVTANEHASEFYAAAGFVSDGPARTTLGGGVLMHLTIGSAASG